MSLIESNMLPIGTKAPAFNLPDVVSGQNISFYGKSKYKGTLVIFMCNHCPFVIHVNAELTALGKELKTEKIRLIAISSNDVENYPDDSPEKMKQFATDSDYEFPYLYDETQEVARAYAAACTPDFYLFNAEDALYYRGRLDESRPGNDKELNGKDLRSAISDLINKKPFPEKQYPSAGCNIKWKK